MVLKKKGSLIIFTAFSVFICILAGAFFAASYNNAYRERSTRLRDDSHLLEELINEYFISNRNILDNIIRQLPLDDLHYPPEDLEKYKSYTELLALIASSSQDTAFSGVIDSRGILSHSSSVDGFNLSRNDFFLEMKTDPGIKYIVSNVFKSPEGRHLVVHAENFDVLDNEFRAMAVIAIDIESFSRWILKLDYTETAKISIIDSNNVLLAQNTDKPSLIGKKYKAIEHVALPSGNFEYREFSRKNGGIRGRYMCIRRISDYPLYVLIEEKDKLLAETGFTLIMIIVGMLISITLAFIVLRAHLAQLKINAELKEALNELDIYFSNSLVGIVILREGRTIYRVNRRILEIFGYSDKDPDYFRGKSVEEFHISKEYSNNFVSTYYDSLKNREVFRVEYPFRHSSGSRIWLSLSGQAIDPAEPPDPFKGVVWIFEDITERREAEIKLKELASTDSLTGLYNRRHFLELGERETAIFRRRKRPVAVMMLDIDHFKIVNDTYGHSTGDKALAHFASVCRESLRTEDIAGRLGGEEFAVILPDTEVEKAVQVAERIRHKTEESTGKNSGSIPAMTVSIGIAAVEHPANLEHALNHADEALYAAKKTGRNKVIVYSADKNDN